MSPVYFNRVVKFLLILAIDNIVSVDFYFYYEDNL